MNIERDEYLDRLGVYDTEENDINPITNPDGIGIHGQYDMITTDLRFLDNNLSAENVGRSWVVYIDDMVNYLRSLYNNGSLRYYEASDCDPMDIDMSGRFNRSPEIRRPRTRNVDISYTNGDKVRYDFGNIDNDMARITLIGFSFDRHRGVF